MRKHRFIRGLIQVLVIIGIVVAGIIIVSRQLTGRGPAKTEEFGAPRLPVMCMRTSQRTVNRMYGFTAMQDQTTARDHLTLLAADRELKLEANAYQNRIETISYEITSLADGSFVENGTVTNMTSKNGIYSADIKISTPIRMNQEYAIRFDMSIRNTEGEPETVYYYTRLIQQTGTNLDAYLSFADHFYRSCLDKNEANSIADYMETDSVASRGDGFDNVTIRSSMDQVTWGDLAPVLYQEAVPEIKEINDQTASIVMDYIISSTDENGATEYYNVHDFYRLRTNQGEIMLIDLMRSAEQIFDAKRSIYQKESINLGVRSADLEYQVSPQKEYAAFVSGSDLWLLGGGDKGYVTRVFSFRADQEPSERTENRSSRISICNVNDEGVVTFVVYGYMSAGKHEGTNGISVFQYSAEENLLEEKLYIATDLGFEILDYSMQRLSYVNANDQLYTYTGTQVLRTDIASGTSQVIKGDVESSCIAVSDDQNFVAWMDEMEPENSTNVTLVNTNTGTTRRISASDGERIRVIGFFNDDLIYGLARENDIVTDAAGNTTFGIYKIMIEGPDGTVRKEYGHEGQYVINYLWSEDNLELNLATRTDAGFEPAGNDHIINNEQASSKELLPSVETDKRCGPQLIFPFSTPKNVTSRVRHSELAQKSEKLNVTLSVPASEDECYYVYANGKLINVVKDVNAALRSGDGNRGVVLDRSQSYIYERGNWKSYHTIDMIAVPPDLRVPTLNAEKIQEAIGSENMVLNYSGCTVESIRYQLSRGYPVVAKFDADRTLVIVGYDIFENLWYYDPEQNEVVAIGKNDSAALFEQQGNLFVSYRQRNTESS